MHGNQKRARLQTGVYIKSSNTGLMLHFHRHWQELDKTKALSSTPPGHDHKCSKHYTQLSCHCAVPKTFVISIINSLLSSQRVGSIIIDNWIITTSIPLEDQRVANVIKRVTDDIIIIIDIIIELSPCKKKLIHWQYC